MNKKHLLTALATLAGTLALYAALGFFAVPALLKHELRVQVEQNFKHRLAVGKVRFNPFTFVLEMEDFELREADGGAMISFKRLSTNFQAVSVFQRAWNFADVTLEAPRLRGELRKDGTTNFSALLAALREPESKPASPLPRLKVNSIKLSTGRIDLADLQAGETARLTIAPIDLRLSDLSTLPGEKGPYKLTAGTADGASLVWEGEISLNPIASSGKIVLSDWKLATLARALGSRISIDEPSGNLAATLQYTVAYAGGKASANVHDFDLHLSQVALTPRGSTLALVAADKFAVTNLAFNYEKRTLSAERIDYDKGGLGLEIAADGQPNWAALLPIHGHTATSEPTHPSTEATPQQQEPPPSKHAGDESPGAEPWQLKVNELAVTDVGLKLFDHRSEAELAYDRASLRLGLTATYARGSADIAIDALQSSIGPITAKTASERVAVSQLACSAGAAKIRLKPSAIEFDIAALKIEGTEIAATRGDSELKAQKLAIGSQGLKAALAQKANNAQQIQIADAQLESTGIGARTGSMRTDTLQLGSLALASKSVTLALGGNTPEAGAASVSAEISAAAVREPTKGVELARLARIELNGGEFNLREQRVNIERLLIADASAKATLAANGTLDWDALIALLKGPPQTASKPAAASAWKALVKNVELRNLSAMVTDQRQAPPLALALTGMNARASNVGTDRRTPAQIELSGRVNESARLTAAGRVNLQTTESDLKLSLTGLSLAPLQSILAQYARLQIVSALASADGRLRIGQRKSLGADVVFEGNVGVNNVKVDETEPSQPFLAAHELKAVDVKLAISPNQVEVPELRIDGLVGKLLIAADRSINLAKVSRSSAASPDAAAESKPKAAVKAGGDDSLPLSIRRIHIDNSQLDFSDLSLRPQFAARLHELKGNIAGVSTKPDSRAQVELDARVDEFGSARIRGDINLFRPRAFTNIAMVFRNIEMTTLTPYAAKFAGYRIASGKLSIDLRYRVKGSNIVGNNNIVLDKLELGERVESPDALNVPLELAIAVLKDSNGRIDIGIPVSGSLDDPQFSYAQVVWKAIGSMLTGIVTAPFRALAGLFGGGSQELDAIEFHPGSDRLAPPEQQKLRTLAEALSKRPQLKLTVKPTYAQEADRIALQSVALRRAIATHTGVKLQPGENPGPIDFANARAQKAIEALYLERHSPAAAQELRKELQQAAAPPGAAQKAVPPPPAELARAMARRLVETQPVGDEVLAALARRRAEAISRALREDGKIDAARIATTPPVAADSDKRKMVPTKLDLGVAR